ncbi:UPF0182 family protein [Tropheryma whipplei]|uniref:UPF0182 family membrane protein n=1 Tax=Tropheryma whipplei TaxID=2039 RepID=UPI00056E1122|nr:UPF0182 family protein [Tropheryma whipplei]
MNIKLRFPRSSLAIAILSVVAFLVLIALTAFFLVHFYSEYLWYDQLGFTGVIVTQWAAIFVVFCLAFVFVSIFLWLCMFSAHKFRPRYTSLSSVLSHYQKVIDPIRKIVVLLVSLGLGAVAGIFAASRWDIVLAWLNKVPTGKSDPIFHNDISFYFFDLPFYRRLLFFLLVTFVLGGILSILISVVYGALRVDGKEIWLSKGARVQYAILAAGIFVLLGLEFWLNRFDTLLSDRSGLITGAAYVEVNALIPGFAVLALVALGVALLFCITAFTSRWRLPIIGVALAVVSALVVITALPWGVQRFHVDPNARVLESEYIKRNIESTRFAYGIDKTHEVLYSAKTDVKPGQLRNDAHTTASIRILDPGLVSRAFGQLQQFRQYYTFGDDLSVDRYHLGGETRDAVVALRELSLSGLGSGNTWVNQALVYTHGYGLVAAYGNDRTPDGEPKFFESGIPTTGLLGKYEPRIYFGRKSPPYSIVGAPSGAAPFEFDYPSSSGGESYTTFKGSGGPKLDSFLKRLIYAMKFGSEQILLSSQVGDYSQILYDRDPIKRVGKVAPWLRLDRNPYPSVVDGRIVWIVDGYTTSDQFPYSDLNSFTTLSQDSQSLPALVNGSDSINYIRNSVKATVDAYSGQVKLYAWDPNDPILKVWEKVFPGTLHPIKEISGDLMSHVRYPLELFNIQRQILARYHVTDPGVFFSHEDAWGIPIDPQKSEPVMQSTGQRRSRTVFSVAQPPYYLTMRMPGQNLAAYSIYSVFIPKSTGENSRSVLTGYLSANSDAGNIPGQISPDYGKLTLLRLSKDQTVPGPGQIQNAFDSDPKVGNQLNILRQGGQTRVLPGNLLTLPVGGGFLYVQPVYVQSTGSTSYTLLQKVLAAFGNKIAFESTLNQALDSLFAGNSGASNSGTSDISIHPPPHSDLIAQIKAALREKVDALTNKDLVKYAQADSKLNELLSRYLDANRG